MSTSDRRPIAFRNAAELSEWLMDHHQRSSEVWVQIFKKGTGKPSVTWTDCVIEAIRND
jgi:uncharacterized protein YdeI (YjbR/CyaY-like superfamily)